MLLIFIRALILYAAVLILMRLMGKRQLGQLQPFELVLTLMIADLATTPMEDPGVPLLYGLVPILALFFAHEGLTLLVLRSERLRALLCGKPSVLILGGRLMQREIRRQRVDLNDLMEQLRLCGVMHIEDVAAAVLEASGQLSVFPKGTKRTVTPGDLSFAPPDDEVPFTLILDGKVNRGNLKKAELTPEALEKMLHAQHIASPKEVFLATIDPQKQLRLQRKEKI